MEPSKGLKHILLDVLGLPSVHVTSAEQLKEQHAAGNSADASADVAVEQQPADAGAAHQSDASRDEHNAAFAARLEHISKQFASDASAAKDAQQFLQEAHKQAQVKETEALAAADAAYTPAWRRTGLPSKASQLQLDDAVLTGSKLLNPAAIAAQQRAHLQKEVLQPPAVFTYCDKSAAPHFLQTTGNQKAREGIAAARNEARSQRPPSPKRPKQLQQATAQRHGSPGRIGKLSPSPAHSQHQSGQQCAAGSTEKQTAAGRMPWSQLPAEEAADKVAAAKARYKAMAAIMTPEQQMIEEKIIKRMYQRLSFLRNPRYRVQQGAAGRKKLPLKGCSTAHIRHKQTQAISKRSAAQPAQYDTRSSMTAAEAGFSVEPAQGVLFDAYEPGGVYFQTVQLQNVATVMKQLRLLPPSSRYFQISFPRFPLESSLLAPGVCAEVDVCFMPDSLGDYEDAFSVEAPAGRFEVQLKGRRPHPELTLLPVLEIGDVLVGNSRSRTFEFVNQGGDGRFLLLTAQQWAAALQQHGHDSRAADSSQSDAFPAEGSSPDASQVPALDGSLVQAAAGGLHAAEGPSWEADEAPAAVTSGPFSISPAYLDLPAGAAAVLAVEFSPEQQGPQSADFVLVCDNCTAHPLRVEGWGEQVRVQLVGLDDREWLPQDAHMPLWFGQVCPGSSSMRQLRVRNATELPFPFKWTVQGCSQGAFTVTPAAGVLQPQAEQIICVEFAPPAVAAHSASLKLSVQRSGDAGLLSISQWGKEGTAVIDLAASASTTLRASAAGPFLQGINSTACHGSLGGIVAAEESTGPEAGADELHCSSSILQSAWPGASAWESVAQLAVEGKGCPISLTVLPTAALSVPGVLTVGDEACLPLQLCNDTAAPAHYRIVAAGKQGAAAADVCIVPSEGVIAAHSVLQLAVHFTALAAGTHQQDYAVEVLHGQTQQLHTYVDIQQVQVVTSIPTLDFGVLCVGASASRTLQLHSTAANSSSFWCVQQWGEQEAVPSTVLRFEPASGCLDPLASCSTVVTVTGSCEGAQKLLIRISSNSAACSSCSGVTGGCRHSTGDGPAAAQMSTCSCSVEYVQVLVLVSSPKVALSKYRLPIQHAYTGVPQHHSIIMTNTSSLPLTFDWAGKQLQHCQAMQLQQQQQQQQQQQPAASKPKLADTRASQSQQQPQAASSSGLHSKQPEEAMPGKDSSLTLPSSSSEASGQILLQISPSTGQLQPGESVRLQLQLEPTAVGPVALLCSCQVPAMSQLVGFLVTAQVGGLQVQYSILRPEEMPWQTQQQPQKRASRRSSSPSGRRASSPNSRRSSSPSGHRASSPSERCNSPSRGVSATAASGQTDSQHSVQFGSSKPRAAAAGPAAGGDSSPPRSVAAGTGANGPVPSAPAASRQLAADFGVVLLHQTAELLLQVTNLTSIPSTVTAWMGHFAAQQSLAATRSLGSCLAGGSSSPWPFAAADPSAEDIQQLGTGIRTTAAHGSSSPVRSAGSQQPEVHSRSSSPCSPSLSSHKRLSSPKAKGQISAALIAGKLSRTDPCTYTGSRVDSSATIRPDALITTISNISPGGSKRAIGSSSSSLLPSSSGSLKGPFRAFPGNAMMAARQAAAAAAAALGSGSLGCAVQLLPEACQLPGWGSCLVRLQAFNSLPGSYVDTLFVQVGDLPTQQIPMTLQVIGTPLLMSKHRVQRQGSDVLHALMHHQHQLLQSHSPADIAGGQVAGCDSTNSTQEDSRAACVLDFGVITAGMEVQKTFFVSNIGSLPVHLAWDWPAPEPIASTAGDSSSGPDTAASAAGLEAGSGAGPEDGLLPGSDEIQGVVAGSRPESAAVPDASNAAASKRPSSTSSTKLARGSSAKGAAGQSKNIKASAAGSTPAAAAAASQAGAKQAAAKARPSVSAGSAAGKKSARGDSGSGTEAAAAVEQHEAGSTTTAAAATGEGMPAPTGANPGGPPGSEEATAAAMAGAKHFDLLSVVGCDDMLPPGGPSSLLETFKRAISPATDTAAGQEGAGSPTAEAPAAAAAGISSVVATSLFSITPAACVIPAGSQQQFVVSFCSSEPRVVQHLALQGRQTLCWPKGSAGQGGCLKVHMLPGARGHAAEGKPMQCHITGGFHPHAGPPPRPMPMLTAALSAAAVAPQLSAADPDLFSWCVTTTHDPSTHPSYLQTATLCNHTGCPQVFRLAVEGPFQLVAAVPSVAQDGDAFRGLLGSASLPVKSATAADKATSKQDPADRLLLLPPGGAVDVSIRFMPAFMAQPLQARTSAAGTRPASGCSTNRSSNTPRARAGTMPASGCSTRRSSNSVQPAGAGPAASSVGPVQHGDGQPLDAPSSTAQHDGALTVTFSTGQQQVVPLYAVVLQPELLVSPSSKVLDFGGVHPAAPRTLELVLTNPTEADAAWEASVIQQRPSATTIAQQPGLLGTAAFTVMPRAGVLQGRGLGPRQARLQVVFEPVSSGASVAELQLRLCGGSTVVVVLRGEGVHAERAELRVGHDL